jgi:hypothetical protein
LNLILSGLPSVPEIRHLLARLLIKPVESVVFVYAWSRWRRQHQAEAAKAHYRKRGVELQL